MACIRTRIRICTRIALVFVLASMSTACSAELQNQLCRRGWTVGHPTMTPERIPMGAEARVHQETEGAKGLD